MLYPKIRDIEKSNKDIKLLEKMSIIISLMCLFINYLISGKIG